MVPSLTDYHFHFSAEEDHREGSGKERMFGSENARELRHFNNSSHSADEWMSAVLEDITRKLVGIRKLGKEPFVLIKGFRNCYRKQWKTYKRCVKRHGN